MGYFNLVSKYIHRNPPPKSADYINQISTLSSSSHSSCPSSWFVLDHSHHFYLTTGNSPNSSWRLLNSLHWVNFATRRDNISTLLFFAETWHSSTRPIQLEEHISRNPVLYRYPRYLTSSRSIKHACLWEILLINSYL